MKAFVLLLVLTSSIPVFCTTSIYNCVDLQNLNDNLNGTYTLMNDIDCSNSSMWHDGAGFIPIGSESLGGFCGSLNGQNYTLWHLEINRPTTDDVGLFSLLCFTAQVFDLQVHDCKINANNYVGTIAARNNGFIHRVNVSGQINGQNYVGGLVSWHTGILSFVQFFGSITCSARSTHTAGIDAINAYGQIIHASALGIIKGGQFVGGIVAENGGSITQVEFIGEITSSDYYTGGLVSYHIPGGILTDSQATANVTGIYLVGGLIGFNKGFASSVQFSGSVVGLFPANFVGGLTGYNDISATLRNGQFNGTVIGAHLTAGAAGGNAGRMEGITIEGTVLTSRDSNYIGGLVGQNTGVIINGNFTGLVQGFLYVGGVVGFDLGTGGIRSIRFSGLVTGHEAGKYIGGLVGYHNGRTLTDAHAVGQVSGSYYVGGAVGASTTSGEITSVTFEGEVVGQNPGEIVGGLAGQLEGSLSNSFVNATVTGHYRVGGAVGFNNLGVIQNTVSYSTVIAQDRLIAGFIGENGGNVSDCTFLGNVTGQIIVAGFIASNTGYVTGCRSSGYIIGGASVGSFIAQNAGFVTNCTTNATVFATSDRVGGIVADNQATGTIEDCFSNVTLSSERDDVGTIVGLNAGVVIRCQGYGIVTGQDKVGGLIGRQLFTGELKQCYADVKVFAESDRAGGAVGENAGLIEECASLSRVSGRDEIGGLIGRSTEITNNVVDSYAAGCVEASSSKGGLTGSQANGVFNNAYWDTGATQQQDPAGKSGSFDLRSYGKSTWDLYHQKTYSNWKFGEDQTWSIVEGHSYPYHKHLELEKLPVEAATHCPRETTFFEIWIPRILFIISFVALGLWLETLGRHYRQRQAIQKNLNNSATTVNASSAPKNAAKSFKLANPMIRETKAGNRGYTSRFSSSGDQLNKALLAAVLNGYYHLAVWLVSLDANPRTETENNETAIHLVVIAGSRLTAYHLMNSSSDPTTWSCRFERILLVLHEDSCSLTEINISAYAVDDEMFRRLIDTMAKNNTVKTLNVSCNNITDLGVTYFAEHTPSLSALESVNLSYNLLSDDGVWALKQKLSTNVNVLLRGNELLSTKRNDWTTINTPPTGLSYYLSSQINQHIPLPWKLTIAKYQIIQTFSFFMGIIGKVLDGFLILELNQTYQEDLTLISFVFFIVSSLLVGFLAIRILYGTWLPHRFEHILRWILFLPLLTPELIRLETRMGYIDSPLVILKLIDFLLTDIPQFVISIIFLSRKGLNLIALARLSFSFSGSVSLLIHMLYSLPTLRNSVRQLRGSAELMMTQLNL